jgi:hypothetical protein
MEVNTQIKKPRLFSLTLVMLANQEASPLQPDPRHAGDAGYFTHVGID